MTPQAHDRGGLPIGGTALDRGGEGIPNELIHN